MLKTYKKGKRKYKNNKSLGWKKQEKIILLELEYNNKTYPHQLYIDQIIKTENVAHTYSDLKGMRRPQYRKQ